MKTILSFIKTGFYIVVFLVIVMFIRWATKDNYYDVEKLPSQTYNMVAEQVEFINIIRDFAANSLGNKSDIVRYDLLRERDKKLCSFIPKKENRIFVYDWIGKIIKIDAYDTNANILITIDGEIALLSSVMGDFRKQVGQMSIGQNIMFSGILFSETAINTNSCNSRKDRGYERDIFGNVKMEQYSFRELFNNPIFDLEIDRLSVIK